MAISLEVLEAAAKDAERAMGDDYSEWYDYFQVADMLHWYGVGDSYTPVDARFISMVSPGVVLELIQRAKS